MDMFLHLVGVFAVVVGVVILKDAPTSIQEIQGLIDPQRPDERA
jgi:hypothetical protein